MNQYPVGNDVKISVELTDSDGQDIIPDSEPHCEITNQNGESITGFEFIQETNGTWSTWWDTIDLNPDVYVINIEVHINGKTFIKQELVEII